MCVCVCVCVCVSVCVCVYLWVLGQVYQVTVGGGSPSLTHRMLLLPSSDRDVILAGTEHKQVNKHRKEVQQTELKN